MMEHIINLDTGVKRVKITIDRERVHELTFNPHDALFLEKGHQIYLDALKKSEELKNEKQEPPQLDENGVPLDINRGMETVRKTNAWFREKIDWWLGDGTSQAVFGDVLFADEKIGIYAQLIEGVMSIVKPEREERVAQYVRKPRKRG